MTHDTSNWPLGVPRDYNELSRDWGKHIQNLVLKFNKVGRNTNDLTSYVWEKLLTSDLLKRYVERMRTGTPTGLDALEACIYLGVTWTQWKTQMGFFHKGLPRGPVDPATGERTRLFGAWMPTPIRGKLTSQVAMFRFNDIVKVGANDTFNKHGQVGTLPAVSRSVDSNFAGYLRQAVHNHICNYVRTKERREKERPFDQFHSFTSRVSQSMEDSPDLESLIVDEFNPTNGGTARICSPDVSAELNRWGNAIREKTGEHSTEIFGLIEDGCTLQEAVKKLDVSAQQRRTIVRSLNSIGLAVST
jgi:hypothetical protein